MYLGTPWVYELWRVQSSARQSPGSQECRQPCCWQPRPGTAVSLPVQGVFEQVSLTLGSLWCCAQCPSHNWPVLNILKNATWTIVTGISSFLLLQQTTEFYFVQLQEAGKSKVKFGESLLPSSRAFLPQWIGIGGSRSWGPCHKDGWKVTFIYEFITSFSIN